MALDIIKLITQLVTTLVANCVFLCMKTTLKQVVNIYNSNRELFWDEAEVLGIEHDYDYDYKIHDEVEIWWLDPWEDCLSNWLFTKILN